ncbi:MAG: metal-sensitive transcriptional regulator [Candidatus Bipolaricaulia bacterium]
MEREEEAVTTLGRESGEGEFKKGSLTVFPKVKQEVLRRMKTVIGHVQGIDKMIEEERYCVDILKQIAAVQAQLSQVSHLLTKSHLKACMTDAVHAGHGDEMVDELMEILKYLR